MTTGRRWAADSREDERLSGLYQQLTELQATRFAAGYDIAAGLDRYWTWLDEHAAEEHSGPGAIPAAGLTVLRAGLGETSAGTAAPGIRQAAAAAEATRASADVCSRTPAAAAGGDAAQAVTTLYRAHYRSLVKLAALLVYDSATAEEVVQDAFVDLHAARRRLPDNDHALSYLRRAVARRAVARRSRSVLRHRVIADKIAPELAPGMPGAQQEAANQPGRSALVSAMQALPPRQREVLALRHYAGLSTAQIASALGISTGAVNSHTARAMSALRTAVHKTSE